MRVSPAEYIEKINRGEERVRQELEKAFPKSSYVALHSVGLSRHAKKPYGEADFVVITDFGIFCLEVKGGNVVRRTDGTWEIGYKETGNYYVSSEGPFKQAAGANAAILNELKANNPVRSRKFRIYWGVVFPDMTFSETDTEWEPDQICDFLKVGDIERYLLTLGELVKKIFSERGIKTTGEAITRDDIEWAASVLRKDIAVSGTKKTLLISSKNELVREDDNQKIILDEFFYGDRKRMVLSGGPGTGKTLLCQSAARHSSESEKKTLFLCFNRPLANQLALSLSDCKNVIVRTVHSFMMETCRSMEVGVQADQIYDHSYFNETLPDLFEEAVFRALDDEKSFFDTLIIDEGQDFLGEHLLALIFSLLRDGFQKGNWLISLDKNVQAEIYSKFDPEALQKVIRNGDCDQRELFRNYRNPRSVGEKANSLYPDLLLPVPSRKFTTYVKIWTYSDDVGMPKVLSRKVMDLLDEGVEPNQISILTFEPRAKSSLNKMNKIGLANLMHLGYSNFSSPDTISWSNVQAFKGLENEFIFLVELSDSAINDTDRAKLFLALTRTLTEAHIICGKKSPILEL